MANHPIPYLVAGRAPTRHKVLHCALIPMASRNWDFIKNVPQLTSASARWLLRPCANKQTDKGRIHTNAFAKPPAAILARSAQLRTRPGSTAKFIARAILSAGVHRVGRKPTRAVRDVLVACPLGPSARVASRVRRVAFLLALRHLCAPFAQPGIFSPKFT